MRGMRAEDERRLEEQLVDVARARLVRREAEVLRSLRELVAETEAQELRRVEAQIRLEGPLAAANRQLGVVVPHAARPASERLELGERVPPEARVRPMVAERERGVWNAVTIRV